MQGMRDERITWMWTRTPMSRNCVDGVLLVEETVFALAWRLNSLPAVQELGLRVSVPLPEDEDCGYRMRYWDGSLVKREAWEVVEGIAAGLRAPAVQVWGDLCECCRDALSGELGSRKEELVGGDGAEARRFVARDTTPIWKMGRTRKHRGDWT